MDRTYSHTFELNEKGLTLASRTNSFFADHSKVVSPLSVIVNVPFLFGLSLFLVSFAWGRLLEEFLVIILGYFFLCLQKNICCGYSSDAPRRGASNEYPQHMFLWRVDEIIP